VRPKPGERSGSGGRPTTASQLLAVPKETSRAVAGGPSGSLRGTLEARCVRWGVQPASNRPVGQRPVLSKTGFAAMLSNTAASSGRLSPKPARINPALSNARRALSSLVAPSDLPLRGDDRCGVSLSGGLTCTLGAGEPRARRFSRVSGATSVTWRSCRHAPGGCRFAMRRHGPRELKVFPDSQRTGLVRATKASRDRSGRSAPPAAPPPE
jgi:hypothetical protein